MSPTPPEEPGRSSAALRWAVAGLLVAAAHGGAGWWIVTRTFAEPVPPDTVQGITIDLDPVAVQQHAPEPNTSMASGAVLTPQAAATPDPQPVPQPTPPPDAAPPDTKAPPDPTPPPPLPTPPEPTPPVPEPPPPEPTPPPPEPKPPVPEPPPPDPAPPVPEPPAPDAAPPPPVPEAAPQAVPVQAPAPVTPPPPPVESKTDAVLAPSPPPPKPKPRPEKPVPPKPDPRRVALEAARRRALAERHEAQRAARAQARAEAAQRAAQAQAEGGRSNQASAPSSASSGASVSTWRGEVVAHLNAYKPASPNGASGTARVAFSVDRAGRVLSASLAGSSGDAALDAAAIAMVRRASPVPAPPPELGGRVSLAVPVWFH